MRTGEWISISRKNCKLLKETVRKFVDRELIPLEREYRPDGEDMPEQLIKPLQEKTKAIGLWMLDVPAEYGGAGLGLMRRCVIRKKSRARCHTVSLAPIFRAGSAAGAVSLQRRTEKALSLPVIRGEKRFCFAQTEPDAGSDPAGMRRGPSKTATITLSTAPSGS